MDPDANLEEQERLREKILNAEEWEATDAIRLAELTAAMDIWISRGGFLPKKWEEARR